MPTVTWRIGTDTRDYVADGLSGKGAASTGGRWNNPGEPVVYTASSIALAALETLVHLGAKTLPLNRYLVEIEIPAAIWDARQTWRPGDLPVGWDAIPEGRVSVEAGSKWLNAAASAVACVPSVVVPEEFNILINPKHPNAGSIRSRKVRRWLYDGRLRDPKRR
jgi:RES domain-containing protein